MGQTTHFSWSGQGRDFRTTHWTIVRDAADKDTNAWQNLCLAYWCPLYYFIRSKGYSPEDAEDCTQDLFAFLFSKNVLEGLHQEGGKFRSWLLAVCDNFLKNQYRREHAKKRRGGKIHVFIDNTAEEHYERELVENTTPEDLYERKWVGRVLERVLARLQEQFRDKGKDKLFQSLRPYLPGQAGVASYSEAARHTGMTEDYLREAVHRLRKRFGKLLREEIAATVSGPDEIDEEIRYLMSVLARN